MSEPTDRELVDASRAGDRDALDALLRRHHARIQLTCRRILHDTSDADDAAQNALISIVRSIDSFDGRSSFSTWAYRIATNAALDEVRRRTRRPRGLTDDLPEPIDERSSGRLAAVDERSSIEAALSHLPIDFRVAVVLRDVLDLDYETIAEIVGVPIGTVRSRIARGRAGLVDRLGNETTGSRRRMDGT